MSDLFSIAEIKGTSPPFLPANTDDFHAAALYAAVKLGLIDNTVYPNVDAVPKVSPLILNAILFHDVPGASVVGGLISTTESPNRSPRPEDFQTPDTLIVHFTSSDVNPDGPVSWFADASSQVSAHIVVGGLAFDKIVQCVPFDKKAWHAGQSVMTLRDGTQRSNVNAYSYGIELCNWGAMRDNRTNTNAGDLSVTACTGKTLSLHPDTYVKDARGGVWPYYTKFQIGVTVLAALGLILVNNGPIYLLGHEEIAPGRKVDPGIAYPLQIARDYLTKMMGVYNPNISLWLAQYPADGRNAVSMVAAPNVVDERHEPADVPDPPHVGVFGTVAGWLSSIHNDIEEASKPAAPPQQQPAPAMTPIGMAPLPPVQAPPPAPTAIIPSRSAQSIPAVAASNFIASLGRMSSHDAIANLFKDEYLTGAENTASGTGFLTGNLSVPHDSDNPLVFTPTVMYGTGVRGTNLDLSVVFYDVTAGGDDFICVNLRGVLPSGVGLSLLQARSNATMNTVAAKLALKPVSWGTPGSPVWPVLPYGVAATAELLNAIVGALTVSGISVNFSGTNDVSRAKNPDAWMRFDTTPTNDSVESSFHDWVFRTFMPGGGNNDAAVVMSRFFVVNDGLAWSGNA